MTSSNGLRPTVQNLNVFSITYRWCSTCLASLPGAPPPCADPAHWLSCRVVSWGRRSLMFSPFASTSLGGGQWPIGEVSPPPHAADPIGVLGPTRCHSCITTASSSISQPPLPILWSEAYVFQLQLQCVVAKEAWVGEALVKAQPLLDVCFGDAIHPAGYWWWNFSHFQWPHYTLVKCELIAPHLILSQELGAVNPCQPIHQLLLYQPPCLSESIDVYCLSRLRMGCSTSFGISSAPATNTVLLFLTPFLI